MPTTKIGLVFYEDDPDQKVFRKIIPTLSDEEIANEYCPCGEHDEHGKRIGKRCGKLHWLAHLPPGRTPRLLIVPNDSPLIERCRKAIGVDDPPTKNGIDEHGCPWPPTGESLGGFLYADTSTDG